MACVNSTTPARRLTLRAGSMLTCPRASWCVDLATRSPADAARDEEKIRQVRRARLLALDARTPSRTVEPTWLSSHGVSRRALACAGGSARVGRRPLACWACARRPSRRALDHVHCAVCAAWSPGSRLDGGIVYEGPSSSTRSSAGRAGRRRLALGMSLDSSAGSCLPRADAFDSSRSSRSRKGPSHSQLAAADRVGRYRFCNRASRTTRRS